MNEEELQADAEFDAPNPQNDAGGNPTNNPNTDEGNTEPRVQISPHPLGGIAVLVRDPAGETLATRIDLPEATILASHLGALITMAFQTMYAEAARAQYAAQQAGSGLIVPGRS